MWRAEEQKTSGARSQRSCRDLGRARRMKENSHTLGIGEDAWREASYSSPLANTGYDPGIRCWWLKTVKKNRVDLKDVMGVEWSELDHYLDVCTGMGVRREHFSLPQHDNAKSFKICPICILWLHDTSIPTHLGITSFLSALGPAKLLSS